MCEGRTTGKTRQPATPVWEKVKVRRLISHCNEMGRRRLLSRFLLCLSWVTVQSVMYELKSEETQLGPSILTQPPDSILWKHNGNKVVEFTGSEESVYGSYEGRIILNWHTAQLKISDLRLEDSGTYEYEIFTRGEMLISSYELEVIEKVAKPAITCEINNSSSSSLSAVLLCSIDQPRSPLMFEWSSDSNVQSGETLTIFLGGELDERQYTCRVSNPVSQETATFTAKDCNTDTGLSSGMVAVVVLIILMLCVGLLMLLYMLKRKDLACFKKGQPRDFENPPPSKGPHKKSAEENRTRAIDRAATLPSSRPLAPCQDLHEEPCWDEEKKSLLTGQPTATSPQPQNQLGAENGTVREKVKKIEQRNREQIFNTLTPKKTGLEQDKVAQDGNVVEEVETSIGMNNLNKEENSGHCKQNDENTQPSATTKQIISEPTDDGKDSNLPLAEATTSADNSAGEESAPLTQSTANLTAQDADGGHDKKLNAETQQPTMNEHRGSDILEGGKEQKLPQGNSDNSEGDQHKTDGEESASEDEATQSVHVVEDEKAGSNLDNRREKEELDDSSQNDDTQLPTTTEQLDSEVSEDVKDPNLSEAEPAKMEHSQQKIGNEDSPDETEAKKNDHVLEEAEASSDLDSASEKDKLGDSNQNDGKDTQLPTTTEQLDSETSVGVKDPNLSEAEAAKTEHSQQKIGNEDSPDETEAKKNDHMLEKAKASSDLDSPSEKDKLGYSNQNDGKDTQLPTTTEKIGSATSESGKGPNLSRAEPAQMEHSQQKIGNEDSLDETEPKTNDHVLEKAKASSDLDSPSEKDKFGDSNQNDDKHTATSTEG